MKKKFIVRTNDIEFNDEKIYFSVLEFNGLFSANFDGGEAEFIGAFPEEYAKARNLHSCILKYKDELLFLPNLSNKITVYNITNNKFEVFDYPIKEKDENLSKFSKTASAVLVDNFAYIFGENNPFIVRFDFFTRELKVYYEWFESFKQYGLRKNITFFCKDIGRYGNSIFAKTHQNSIIIEFNIKEEKVFFHKVGNILSSVLGFEKDKIWLFAKEGKCLSSWDFNRNFLQTLQFEENLLQECGFECSCMRENELWLFPYPYGKRYPILVFNLENKNLKKIDMKGYVRFCKVRENKIYFMTKNDNCFFCFSNSDNMLFSNFLYVNMDKDARLLFYYYPFINEKDIETQSINSLDMLITAMNNDIYYKLSQDLCGERIEKNMVQNIRSI